MKNQTRPIEELLRNKLEGYRDSVEEQEWLDLQVKRGKRQKRRGIFYFSIIGFSMMMTVLGFTADETWQHAWFAEAQEKTAERLVVIQPNSVEAKQTPAKSSLNSSKKEGLDSKAVGAEEKVKAPVPIEAQGDFNLPRDEAKKPAQALKSVHSLDKDSPLETERKLENTVSDRFAPRLVQRMALKGLPLLAAQFELASPLEIEKKQTPTPSKRPDRPEFHPFGFYLGYTYAKGNAAWQGPNKPDDEVNRAMTQSRTNDNMLLIRKGFAVGVEYTTSTGFGISSGFHFQSMQRDYSQTLKITEFPILDADGRIITYVPLVDSFHREESINGQQQISSYSLPIGIRQSIRLGNRVHLGIQLNMQMGLNYGTAYQSFNPVTLEREVSSGNVNPFNFQYGGGLFLNYRPTPFWGGNITFTHTRSNLLFKQSESFNMQPRYYNVSIQLIRYL